MTLIQPSVRHSMNSRTWCFLRSWMFLLFVLITPLAMADEESVGTLLVFLPNAVEVARVGVVRYDFEAVRRNFAEGIFRTCDLDQDTTLNPDEAVRLPMWDAKIGQLRLLGHDWRAADISPTDRKLSLSEVRQWLNRTLGPPIKIEVDERGTTRAAQLFTLIDLNGDGRLEPSEFSASGPHLNRCDFDDDEMLTLSELSEMTSESDSRSREPPSTEPFLWIERGSNLTDAAREIESRYRPPNATGVPLETIHGVNADADINADRLLGTAELEQALAKPESSSWLKILPTSAGCGTRWLAPTDDAEVRSFRRAEKAKLDGLEFKIDFRSSELLERLRREELNTQFGDADQDNNDYLSRIEYANLISVAMTNLPADPNVVDLNNNQQISREELLAAGDLRALISRCQLQLTVVRESMSLFKMLDLDRNQGISSWEIQTAAPRLESLDLNRDGSLSGGELSKELMLEVGFAGARTESTPMNVIRSRGRTVPRRSNATGPAWFQRMDRNQDQRISWREFLGSREQFNALDKDQDGAVSGAEAKP